MKKYMLFTIVLGSLIACQQTPPPKNADGSVSGFDIYQSKCGLCHGQDGKLGISGAKDLSQSRLGLEERVLIIKKGKGSMPGFATLLSEAEIQAVAIYIEKLRP